MPIKNFDRFYFISVTRFISFESHLVISPKIKCVPKLLSILIKKIIWHEMLLFFVFGRKNRCGFTYRKDE